MSDENAALYAGQRSVAETLQHSLLPARLADVPGLEVASQYLPGVASLDIGGDWYDAIPLDDGRLMLVVGDVSGRGLGAATVMASLRFAIRAFASQGRTPAVVLTKLTSLLDVSVDGHFATVLCAVVDIPTRTCTLANAGHPNPLLAKEYSACFVDIKVGLPIGVKRGAEYETATAAIPPGATMMMFTDGLFERRREPVDIGLERLRESATRPSGSVTDLLAQVVNAQISDGADDDTAILGVRWQN